jgi:hypothetical protein
MTKNNQSNAPGGRPGGRRGLGATIKHYHVSYLRDLGEKIGTDDISECLNFALNLLRSGQSISPISSEATPDPFKVVHGVAPDAAMNGQALVSALSDLFQ